MKKKKNGSYRKYLKRKLYDADEDPVENNRDMGDLNENTQI